MPFIIDARNMGGGSIGSAAGGDTSTGTRNNVTLAAPWDENKEYLKGDLATNNGDLYQAQKSVPAGVQISDADYWALVVVGDKSKETEQLRKDIGSLAELETESKDNLVNAINEVGSIQSDWNQNDDTKKDYIKGRTHWAEIKPVVEKVNVITDASYKYDSQGSYKINGAFMCPYPPNIELTEGTPITITIETKSFTGQLSASTDTNLLEFSLKNQQVNGYKVPSAWYFFLEEHSISIYGEGSSNNPAMSFSIAAEIEQEREVVHTLDPKYIEDMYYTKTIPGNTLLCAFDVSEGKHTSVELAFPLVVDSEYNLTIDGDSYGGNVAIDNGTITLNCAHGVLTVEPHNPLLGRWDGNPLKHHIEIAEYNHKIIHQIDPKYIPNQNTVFEARLFPDGSIPYRLNLESGIAVGDLVNAFDEGRRVIARLCPYEDDYGYPFEMQMYQPGSSSGAPDTIMFAPCSISSASIYGEIPGMNTVIIGFEDGDWYFSGFSLDSIGGAAFETPYTVPFEVNAMYCNTFDKLVSATHDFRWRAYIYKGDYKLYLQVPEYSPSVTPSVLYFTGITEPDDTRMSRCVWTVIKIPVSSSNVILWDDSTLPISNTALDTWENYRLDKDQSGALYIYDVFNNKIDLGLVGAGVIEYQGYRYLFNKEDGAFVEFYCTDFTNKSEPKISTIELNRRINKVTVTNFQPLWEIATESEVNNAVDDIFKTI